MTDTDRIGLLQKSIASYTRFIESKSTPTNSREKAIETRDRLQEDLNRLLSRFVNV